MCSKSNPIVVFALDLMSTYEGEHTIFGLLGQANCRGDFECYHWKELINSWGNGYANYPESMITCISKHHIVLHKYVKFIVYIKSK
jgi:hypothetical protein